MSAAASTRTIAQNANVDVIAAPSIVTVVPSGLDAPLVFLPVHGSYLSDLLVGLLPMSLGMGLTFVPVTLLATAGVPPEDSGLASGLLNTSQQVGGALGLAVLSTLSASRTTSLLADGASRPEALVGGWQVAFIGGAILLGSAALSLIVLLRRRHLADVDVDAAVPVAA